MSWWIRPTRQATDPRYDSRADYWAIARWLAVPLALGLLLWWLAWLVVQLALQAAHFGRVTA